MIIDKSFWHRMRRSIDNAVEYAPVAAEDKARLKHYLVFTFCGVPTMLVFLLVNHNKGNHLLCALILASAAGLVISWFKVLTAENCRIVFRINSILFGILLIYMFVFGGEDGSKSLWMFIFPLIVFLLLGKKEGIVWAGSMLLIVLLSLAIPHSIVDKYQYSSAYLIRFTTIYLIISTMTYWFEHFRFNYRSVMQTEQRRFQEIFNHSRDVLYRRNLQSGQYHYISKAFGEHLGYSPTEVASFSYQEIKALIHPDDRDKHDPVLPEILNSKPSHGVTPPVEFRMRHKDGHYLWFSDQMVVIYNDENEPEAVLGINREITLQRQIKLALRDARDQLFTILNSIDAHIYVSDMESYEILFMNNKMKEDFGHDKEGETCWLEFRNNEGPCSHCYNDRLLAENGQPAGVYEWEGFNPLTNQWYNNYNRAIRWVDGRWVRIQIAVNISQMKYLENERQRNKDIVARANHLEAVSTLAAGISHDFNNLLQIILGNLSLAEHISSLSDEGEVCFREIERAVIKAQKLAAQMVELSSKGSASKTSTPLKPLLERSAAELTAGTTIKWQLRIAPDLAYIPADYNQILSAIKNIITNSCESMPGQGYLKIVAENHIQNSQNENEPYAVKNGKYVKIRIDDNGCGIPKADMARIFEPYYSTKERSARKGLGLGLTIAYSIITQHDGHIFVESERNLGTSVIVFLPVADREVE